jgi:hypothetical protein
MFTFEHTYQLTEAEYVAIWALNSQRPRPRWARRIGASLVGVACLFHPYTMLLGLALLGLMTLVIFMPHIFSGTAARTFRQFRYLDEPVVYGVDANLMWVQTSDFHTRASWRHLTVWREREGWLILQGNGFPAVLLPIATLRARGLYEAVKQKAQQHGVEFGSRAAQRRAV